MSKTNFPVNRKWLDCVLLTVLFLLGMPQMPQACPACWSGYGPGDERFNKPLADLRKTYERLGREALPDIRQALISSTDPLVVRRAAAYILEFQDQVGIPLLEDKLLDLVRRVAFSSFGLGTDAFLSRMSAAHALAGFKKQDISDRLWKKYHKLEWKRKDEIPYLLHALGDPLLEEKLQWIIRQQEDHQLMLGALDVMAMGGSRKSESFLEEKLHGWEKRETGTGRNPRPGGEVIFYLPLAIKAKSALWAIRVTK